MITADMTQCEMILAYLDEVGPLTQKKASDDLGITKLATRVSELLRAGEKIEKRDIVVNDRWGKKTIVKEYRRGA